MIEEEFINKYLTKLIKNNKSAKNLNDDVFFDKHNKIAISIDTYNEGIHFLNFNNPSLLIKKIIRSSISDLICKGVKPKYYFISASLKKKTLNNKLSKLLIKSLMEEQKKFNIKISGGDTVSGKFVSFTIVSVGFANKIIERNNAKLNDDIYVTGNIGDSYIGLQLLKKKIKISNKILKDYFIKKFYVPNIPFKSIKLIQKFSNSSIDVSDGLLLDLNKLLNRQKLNYLVDIEKIPVSNQLKKFYIKNNYKPEKFLFNGDDYQTIFTAKPLYRRKILNNFKKINQKISIIGKIIKFNKTNFLKIDKNIKKITNYQGYSHNL